MGKKTVSLTLRIPEDVHKKLKILSVVSGKTMTDEIIQMIERVNLKVPDFSKPVKKKPVKAVEHPEIKEAILKLKAEGLSLQKICDRLEADGVASARGGKWNRGTIARMVKRWSPQNDVK
jgi:hypothetical protein